MAHFYGTMQGNRGMTSRMGSKQSGLSAHVRGWNIGAEVEVMHRDGVDVVRVYRTAGSNGASNQKLIAEFDSQGNDLFSQGKLLKSLLVHTIEQLEAYEFDADRMPALPNWANNLLEYLRDYSSTINK